MSETKTLLALFEDIDPASAAIDHLHDMGLSDEQINVISGIPLTEKILGRPRQWSNVPRLALGGAIAGFLMGSFLAVGTPLLYSLQVGRQGFVPGPPSVVIWFEITMLGMLVSTFIGVFLDSTFPNYRPKEYVPDISDGKIAILFQCPTERETAFVNAMTELNAQSVTTAEAQTL
jgi:hypothetical protein